MQLIPFHNQWLNLFSFWRKKFRLLRPENFFQIFTNNAIPKTVVKLILVLEEKIPLIIPGKTHFILIQIIRIHKERLNPFLFQREKIGPQSRKSLFYLIQIMRIDQEGGIYQSFYSQRATGFSQRPIRVPALSLAFLCVLHFFLYALCG